MAEHEDEHDLRIERKDTGLRLGLTLLFLLIAEVVQTVLTVLIGFSLLFAFATRRRPSETVRQASNQVSAYLYRIYRYLTYNDARAPFPFSPFAGTIEPGRWSDDTTESELLQSTLSGRRGERPEEDDWDPDAGDGQR